MQVWKVTVNKETYKEEKNVLQRKHRLWGWPRTKHLGKLVHLQYVVVIDKAFLKIIRKGRIEKVAENGKGNGKDAGWETFRLS